MPPGHQMKKKIVENCGKFFVYLFSRFCFQKFRKLFSKTVSLFLIPIFLNDNLNTSAPVNGAPTHNCKH